MLAIRRATPEDFRLIAALFPELAVADPPPDAATFAATMVATTLVAERDGKGAGYVFHRQYGEVAHVVHLVVAPAHRGERVGEALLEATRARVREEGATRWYLNVKADNRSAIRLYERVGLRKEGAAWALRMPWAAADAMPVDPHATAFVPAASEEPALALRFQVLPERLAVLRARPGSALVALREGDALATVALAALDPHFPGAYPFRAVRASLAGNLLRALRPFALAAFDHVYVTVEDDEELRGALLAGGAELFHAVDRMAAPL